MRILYCLLFLSLLLFSCTKDNADNNGNNAGSSFSLAVLNEGNFTWGNASLTLINEDSGIVVQDYFKSVNNAPLGDVAQSILEWDNRYWIVVNNSGKIEVLDQDWERQHTISNLTSPRYILPVSSEKAYVSDLYANAIHIIDLQSLQKISEIKANGWTEEMVALNDKVYVQDIDNDQILIIDPSADQLIDSIALGASPNSILIENSTNLLLLNASENANNSELLRYNSNLEIIEETIAINGSCNLLRKKGDNVYYLKNSSELFSAPLSNLADERQVLDLGNRNIYGFEIIADRIYLTDAKDYARSGTLLIYENAMQPVFVDSFKTGSIPKGILSLD